MFLTGYSRESGWVFRMHYNSVYKISMYNINCHHKYTSLVSRPFGGKKKVSVDMIEKLYKLTRCLVRSFWTNLFIYNLVHAHAMCTRLLASKGLGTRLIG